ncbi:MAG: bifunctional adenosylcobinamide kinase/adenosylcobinamide-phosphate guanylyltransferase [Ghiorsea sp.]
MAVTLVLGGARSGKSKHAEALAEQTGLMVTYIATAPSFKDDAEWQKRIAQHQLQRPATWATIEEELGLVKVLDKANQPVCILIDCLSLWMSNLMFAEKDVAHEVEQLCLMLADYQGDVILVSSEVGMGLVPEQALGRRFRDELGILNQKVASVADVVLFVAAGLALRLKG